MKWLVENYNKPGHAKGKIKAPWLTDLNRKRNPELGRNLEARIKRGDLQRDRGEGKTYRKYLGKHEHRAVAEQKLGRPLKPGEIVHHKNGNKRDNSPDNIMVFPSKAEHNKWHAQNDATWGRRKIKGGDVHETP